MIERSRVRVPAGAAGEFLLQSWHSVLTLIRCPFQWHVKDPEHSAKSAGRRLHPNMHAPLTQRSRSGPTMLSKNSAGTYHGNELTRSLSGNTATVVSAR